MRSSSGCRRSFTFAVLRGLMPSAVDDGLIVANPRCRVPLPRIERRVVEPLEASSLVALLGAMPPRYAVTVLLGVCAGSAAPRRLRRVCARVRRSA